MYYYSKHSKNSLSTAHPLWTEILTYVLEVIEMDHKVLEGYRNQTSQNDAFARGASTLKWPQSKHNHLPSLAVDVVPFPILWNDSDKNVKDKYLREMVRFATIVQMVAKFKFGVTVRWGGDWDRDWSIMDNVFNDYPHLELIL